ncbi:FtsX-like permease family protein [bacterium SCSIO 12696]|nr:FtsX-like permease family protein [bacterium SCSIO 12696]
MKPVMLAGQMLRRDWRAGELRVLLLALIVAVIAVTTINLLTDRFARLLQQQSAQLVGADLILTNSREPNPDWLQQGRDLGLDTAETTEFATVVAFNDEFLLTNIKAVSDRYPLRGELRTALRPYGEEYGVNHPPEPGSVWVDVRVLTRLGVELGDTVSLGASEFRIDRILTYEPDSVGGLFNFNPRVLMNAADLAATEVVQPGSRITYSYLFAGDSSQQLRAQLEPQLGPGHRFRSARGASGRTGNIADRAEQFLGLSALLTVFLAAVAIAMAARRYSERHFDVSGLLRCLGLQQAALVKLYVWQLLLLALLAGAIGTVLGWLVHLGLLDVIQSLLTTQVPVASAAPYFTGIATALLLVLGVALPPVLRLKSIPPLRVFRRELTPVPPSAWLVYGVAFGALAGLLLMLFDNIAEVLLILCVAAVAIGVLGALVFVLLRWLRGSLSASAAAGKLWLRSLRNLVGHTGTTTGQLLAFGLTAMVMVILVLLRTDLVNEWQAQLPKDAPNKFVFNIQPFERQAFQQQLADAGLETKLYPIVRGRLLWEGEEGKDNSAPNRELNFTWLEQLPENNKIVSGEWRSQSVQPEISVEQDLAERLGIQLGDSLNFDIAGTQISATVTSLRTVNWQSFSPNFYIIFQPGVLEDFSAYYLTSFRLPEQQQPLLLDLLKAFPSISLIEVDAIVRQARQMLGQVSLMVELMLLFVLVAGVTVLLASIQSTLDERLREGALMRAFGASRRYLRSATLAEYSLLGVLAGVFAALGVELACQQLYQRVFDISYQSSLLLWLLLPLLLGSITGLCGYLSTRKVLQVSPRALL